MRIIQTITEDKVQSLTTQYEKITKKGKEKELDYTI